jgi:hypothetical protein
MTVEHEGEKRNKENGKNNRSRLKTVLSQGLSDIIEIL